MKFLTLQNRITLYSAVVITIGLLLCGVSVVLLTHRDEITEMDEQLKAESDGFFREWHRQGGPSFNATGEKHELAEWLTTIEESRYVEVADTAGRVLYRSQPFGDDILHHLPLGFETIRILGRPWRYGGFTQGTLILRLTVDLEPVNSLSRVIATAFGVTLPLLLTFLALSLRWAARAALEPLREITGAAERITAEQPHQTVPVPAARDEIRRLALVLNESFARLHQSYLQAQRFSADASHELKTPLTVQRAAIESLLDSPDLSPSQAETVSSLLEQTHRLSAITESLLLLSRADAGRLQLDFALDDVTEILNACVDDAHILAEPRQLALDAVVPPLLKASVDRVRLSQIVLNLLDNAVKYNREGGRIRLSATVESESIVVAVGNTGPGITPAHIPQLFDRFFRSAPGRDQPGHGLGLSLALELARAHGGELKLTHTEADWTEFRLVIPAKASAGSGEPALAAR